MQFRMQINICMLYRWNRKSQLRSEDSATVILILLNSCLSFADNPIPAM